MNYFLIFLFKLFENTIATLRLILVSNGKKLLGSILLLLTSIIWIISSSVAIINFNIVVIICFSLGSFIGSFLGSILEEKLALGNNLIICIPTFPISDILRNEGYIITNIYGSGINSKKEILFIILKRKQNKNLIKRINELDKKAIITSEYINVL